jgi:maltose O-acetyltransferase
MPTELEKMLAGELYNPYEAELVRMRDRTRDLCFDLNQLRSSDEAQRRMILSELFGSGGDDVSLNSPFYCDYGSNIFFGKNAF